MPDAIEPDLSRLPHFAYYLPTHLIRRGFESASTTSAWDDTTEWLKTLLLFFDGLAVDQNTRSPEWLDTLEDSGHLRRIDVREKALITASRDDRTLLGRRTSIALDTADSAFDFGRYLRRSGATSVHAGDWELAWLRLGMMLIERNQKRARTEWGIALEPVADTGDSTRQIVDRLSEIPGFGTLIELDLTTVTFNLDAVPLDEVLGFRKEHGGQFRHYRRQLNQLLITMAHLPERDNLRLLADRREELQDLRDDLLRRTRSGFRLKNLLPFGLGMTGAVLTGASGDYVGAVGSALGASGSIKGEADTRLGAYSYLFSAQEEWRGR